MSELNSSANLIYRTTQYGKTYEFGETKLDEFDIGQCYDVLKENPKDIYDRVKPKTN